MSKRNCLMDCTANSKKPKHGTNNNFFIKIRKNVHYLHAKRICTFNAVSHTLFHLYPGIPSYTPLTLCPQLSYKLHLAILLHPLWWTTCHHQELCSSLSIMPWGIETSSTSCSMHILYSLVVGGTKGFFHSKLEITALPSSSDTSMRLTSSLLKKGATYSFVWDNFHKYECTNQLSS